MIMPSLLIWARMLYWLPFQYYFGTWRTRLTNCFAREDGCQQPRSCLNILELRHSSTHRQAA
jgi:hypothetical protein